MSGRTIRRRSPQSTEPQSIDEVSEEMRTVSQAIDPAATSGRWQIGVWPWRRRWLHRRYDTLQLEAARMLGVATPPRSEWSPPGFRGGLYDSRTGFVIEEALRQAGFDPFTVKDVPQ